MIEREFCGPEGSKAVGFSHTDFGFVVEPFDNAAGELLAGPEVIEQEFAMVAHGTSELLHRRDSRAHGLGAPLIEELSGPSRRIVLPELLELLLEQVGAHALQVVAHQLAELQALPVGGVLGALEQAPSRSLEQRLVAL